VTGIIQLFKARKSV